jgi:hypothetical protein
MSEHQCYEFVALDRPLTSKEMAELRAISTRAEITPTRFWNEYDWGDLKADPAKLLERFFDAHLYFANWGSRRLMLRIPAKHVDPRGLRAYFVGGTERSWRAGRHVILDLCSEDEHLEYDDENQGSLAAIAPVRAELVRGDLRAAYLAWLLAVQTGDVDDDDVEPPVPPGLSDLTAAEVAMVEFLRIDEDLLAAAATASRADTGDRDALREWVRRVPPRTRDEWIARAIDDPQFALGSELRRAFRASMKMPSSPRRTVASLRAAAAQKQANRERADARAIAKAKKAAAAARAKRLDALSRRLGAAWTKLEALVENSSYDEAIDLSVDLRDLARRDGESKPFAGRFDAMRKRQRRRRGFFDRWDRDNGRDSGRA